MFRIFIAIILCGLFLQLTAQSNKPALSESSKTVVTIPGHLQFLSPKINSPFEETAPLISADGKTLYFTRRGHPRNFGQNKAGDIWMSKREPNGDWGRPVNVGAPLNNIYHNVPVALDPSGLVIFLTNNYFDSDHGLVWAKKEGRSWTDPAPCEIEDFYTIGDGAEYYLSADGNVLLLGLERREGFGRRDIYVAFRQGEFQWSAPVNLGPVINTSKEEARAFLAADGKSLYFSSRGHGGRGGLDLFYSRRLDDSWTNWSEPKNLGEDINSPLDDEYISMPATGDPVYLVYRDSSSNNLYTGHLPLEMRPEAITLVHAKIQLPEKKTLDQLRVTSMDINAKQVPRALPVNKDGSFTVILQPGEELGVQVEAPGYFPYSTYFEGQMVDRSAHTDQGVLLASAEMSPEYFTRDNEIRNLRLRLNQIDEELAEMRKQKEKYLNDLKGQGLQSPMRQSDPELVALRHKFETLNRPVTIDTVPVQKEKDWQNKGSLIPEKDANRGTADDELADMKKRFNRFYQLNEHEVQDREEENFLWKEESDFDRFQQEVKEKMLRELKPQVGDDLVREIWPQVRASLAGSLAPESMVILDEKESEIKSQITHQLKNASIIIERSPIEMPSWQYALEEDLRTKMEPAIRSELEQAMKEDVRNTLTHEAFFQIRREEADRLNVRLEEKIDLQIQEEERQMPAEMKIDPGSIGVKGGTEATPSTYEEEDRELVLLSPEKGAVLPLNNVFFKPNTDEFKEISFLELDRVVHFLVENPNIEVEVACHTNGWLGHSVALQLSEKRAKAIADYFFNLGVSGTQVQYRGYGKTRPIASNDTLEGRRKNQRVELHILGN